MTDKEQPVTAPELDQDDVFDEDTSEAQLFYRGVARGKDDKKTSRGPVVLAGGTAPAGGAPRTDVAGPVPAPVPGGGTTSPAAATSGAVLGATAFQTEEASADVVRFSDQAVKARHPESEADDPWGAYDNPDNVPGLALDDDDAEEDRTGFGGMALRGSGTRGSRDSAGRMAPIVPMTGGGAGGAGATAPGATLGGVGASSGMAAQQPHLAIQAALTGTQQGSVPLTALAGLNSARASGAMMSPPATGVMAAGSDGDVTLGGASLDETIRRLGIDSDQPYVVGPDGNLYPNPYYRPAASADHPHVVGAGADLNGDGVVTDWERERWLAGQERTGDGHTGGAGAGVSAPSDSGGAYSGGGTSGAVPGGSHSGSGSGGYSGGGPETGSGGYTYPGTGGAYGSGSGGYTGSGGSASTGYSGSVPGGHMGSGGSASGSDYSVRTDELRDESRDWDQIAERQEQMAEDVSSMPDPAPTFGVLSSMVPPYSAVQDASAESAQEAGTESHYTASGLDQNAANYEANENDGTAIAGRIND